VEQARGRQATDGRSLATCGSHFIHPTSPIFLPASPFFPLLPPLLGTLVNSTSLALVHARPTQTLP
jgi:hypothetical protein